MSWSAAPAKHGCGVCWTSESWGGDLLVYCDVCNVAVHQLCYGVETSLFYFVSILVNKQLIFVN